MKLPKEIYDYTFIEQADKEFLVEIIKKYRRVGGLFSIFVLLPMIVIDIYCFCVTIGNILTDWNSSLNFNATLGNICLAMVLVVWLFIAILPAVVLSTDWLVDRLYRSIHVEVEAEDEEEIYIGVIP